METADKKTEAIKGGEFLIRDTKAQEIFIPEEWTEEQQMIAQMCQDFLATEVFILPSASFMLSTTASGTK